MRNWYQISIVVRMRVDLNLTMMVSDDIPLMACFKKNGKQ